MLDEWYSNKFCFLVSAFLLLPVPLVTLVIVNNDNLLLICRQLFHHSFFEDSILHNIVYYSEVFNSLFYLSSILIFTCIYSISVNLNLISESCRIPWLYTICVSFHLLGNALILGIFSFYILFYTCCQPPTLGISYIEKVMGIGYTTQEVKEISKEQIKERMSQMFPNKETFGDLTKDELKTLVTEICVAYEQTYHFPIEKGDTLYNIYIDIFERNENYNYMLVSSANMPISNIPTGIIESITKFTFTYPGSEDMCIIENAVLNTWLSN